MRQAFDEMNGNGGQGVRSPYSAFAEWLGTQKLEDLKRKSVEAETLFRRTGITFSVYGNEDAGERLIPFDIIPRILSASEWRRLTVRDTRAMRSLWRPKAFSQKATSMPSFVRACMSSCRTSSLAITGSVAKSPKRIISTGEEGMVIGCSSRLIM